MLHLDASAVECQVFTYKEGLLSSIAHDLKLRVTRLSMDVDVDRLTVAAQFDATSLRVVTAMRDGRDAPELLSESDRSKIERTISTEVLNAAKYPQISFVSTEIAAAEGGFAGSGKLTLHGQTRTLRFAVQTTASQYEVVLNLHQPDYDIKPYKAMLGTLRIAADVKIRLSMSRSLPT